MIKHRLASYCSSSSTRGHQVLLSVQHLSLTFTPASHRGITRAEPAPLSNAPHFRSNEEKDDEWEQAAEEPGGCWKHTRLQATRGALSIITSDSTMSALWIFDRGHRCSMHTLTGTHTWMNSSLQIYEMHTHTHTHTHTHSTSNSVDLPWNSISESTTTPTQKKKVPGAFWNILMHIFRQCQHYSTSL